MRQVLEGSHAISEAVRLAKVQVVAGYPITPQTHIIEAISQQCADGSLKARFIPVESEHSSMAAVIGAAATGVRAFTATSSHGLALMHEVLHWASAARLPIVMGEVNRALGPGWNIWMDQSDSLAQRDTGWIQLYCEDAQDALDTTLIAFRLAETVNLPAMVVIDAFYVSHTFEPVDVPEPEMVDRFLPPLEPRFRIDVDHPQALYPMVGPAFFMEMRRSIQDGMEAAGPAFDAIADEFESVFGRRHHAVETAGCDDADLVLVTTGSVTSTARIVVARQREQGKRVGLCKIKQFRPFPADTIRAVLGPVPRIAVIDRNVSFGSGGIFAREIQGALSPLEKRPPVYSYIAGLGGRDITPETIAEVLRLAEETPTPAAESCWVGLNPAVGP
jgi:pyruvate/2-oxoacid:ferredoxin oxidoreductase alpha subunit